MSMGVVLFRNENDLKYIRHSSEYIIRRNSVDMGRFTLEGSRPFASLKPWAALKIIGREGYGLLLKRARESTETLKQLLDHCGNFETLNDPELFILTYRFIPEKVRKLLLTLERSASSSTLRDRDRVAMRKLRKTNNLLNGLNRKLHKSLRMDDTTFVSRTKLESTRYRPQNIVVLRAVLINPLTDEKILEEIVDTHNRIGLELWRGFEPAFQKILNTV